MLERPDLLVVRPQDGGQVARRVGQPVQLDLAPPQLPTQDAVLLRKLLKVEWIEWDRRGDESKGGQRKRACLLHSLLHRRRNQSSVWEIDSLRYENPYSIILLSTISLLTDIINSNKHVSVKEKY